MIFNMTAGTAVIAGMLMAVVPVFGQANTPQEDKNLKMALDFQREVITFGHMELASKYMAADFVEHNPNVAKPGRAGFVEYFGTKIPVKPIQKSMPKPLAKVFAKGDYVVLVDVIDDVDSAGKKFQYNTYDVVRVQDGKIQEHWDEQPKTAPSAPLTVSTSASPQFKNSADEQKNEDIVLNLYRDVLQYHHFELASKYIAADYIQHNHTDPQGRDPLMEHIQKERPSPPEPLQPQMKNRPNLIITKGDIVLMMTTRKVKDPSDASRMYEANHFEMVRVQNGLAQEHWDSSIGPGGKRN